MNLEKIEDLIKKGDECQDQKKFEASIYIYVDALRLVTEPFLDQEISKEILTAIGDSYFFIKNYEKASEAFDDARMCPSGGGDPYINLRRGQIAFELGDQKKATNELACAYLNGGKEVFDSEDSKYLDFIKPFLNTL